MDFAFAARRRRRNTSVLPMARVHSMLAEGKSHKEIAADFGITVGALNFHLRKAKVVTPAASVEQEN